MMTFIYIVGLFLGSQAFLMKGKLPTKYLQIKLRYFLLAAIITIGLSAIVGQWFGVGTYLALTSTILSSSVLIYRFQIKYEEMEQGKL